MSGGPAAPRTVTVSPYGPRQVPMLRLRGAWLLAVGFSNGTRVAVTVEAGRLVLRQVKALKSERVQ
jgi:Toxin SymE, type I toxin-antitoxin system